MFSRRVFVLFSRRDAEGAESAQRSRFFLKRIGVKGLSFESLDPKCPLRRLCALCGSAREKEFSFCSSHRVVFLFLARSGFVLAQRRRGRRVSAEEYFFKKATLRENLLVHILLVTSILYGDGVTIDGVGIVPVAGMSHVVALPSGYGWQSAEQRHFNLPTIINSAMHIPLHIVKRKCVLILQQHMCIEIDNMRNCFWRYIIRVQHSSAYLITLIHPSPHRVLLLTTCFCWVYAALHFA